MPTIQISKKLKNLNITDFYNKIYDITLNETEGLFVVDKITDIVNPINGDKNIKLVLYIIYTILKTDNLSPKELFPKPKHGIELSNPYTKQLYGIYHVHLRDNYVLVWYATFTNNGYVIKFDYIYHPPSNDDYRTITKEIYNRNDSGYNFDIGESFINLTNILHINESLKIDTYKDFIRNINI